ncbi:MAG: glycosyltransferase family A protein [Candidatus Caenarcaniphilales bacterium]|nr:glycosyltransferase family A protein [Candidatus Caenarcaniphilales bacterium]
MKAITFSILICNYNYGRFVGEAIQSCLKQNYPQELYEIIVVDDGSTDDSREVLAKYKNLPHVKIIEQKNEGQASAFWTAAFRANNDFICLLDSDDYFHPDKLNQVAKRISSFETFPYNLFLCHDTEILDQVKGKALDISGFDIINLPLSQLESLTIDQINHHFPFATPSGQVFSSKLFKSVINSIPLSEWKICADEPIAHGALLETGEVVYFNQKLSTYRIHDQNFALKLTESGNLEPKGNWEKHRPKLLAFLERFVSTLPINARERAERFNYIYQQEKLVKRSSMRKKYTEPKVSFIVTNYNYSKYLERCLDSVIRQTHNNWELIVVDDCSTDESMQLLEKYKVKHSEIRVVQNENNLGQLGSMRTGYQEAQGHYVCFVDADDVLDEYFTERHLYVHRFVALCMVTSCDISFIDQDDCLIHSNFYTYSGYWKQDAEYFLPLSSSINGWAFSPCSANMLRKTKQLDLFFNALDPETIKAFRVPGDWLVLHYAHALGGNVRFREGLVNFRLHDKNNCTQLHFPSNLVRDLRSNPPDSEAGIIFLFGLLCNHFEEFKLHYLPIGLKRYIEWLVDQDLNIANTLLEKAKKLNASSEVIFVLEDLINRNKANFQNAQKRIQEKIFTNQIQN